MFRNFCSVRTLFITTVALLVILAGVLVLFFVGIPLIIKDQLHQQTQLKNGTDQFDRFVELPFALEFKVWIWVVENPDEILAGEKPKLRQQGPYVYLQYRNKDILSINKTGDTVSYEQHMTMIFNESLSEGNSDEDEVTVINSVYLATIQMSSDIERLVMAGCMDRLFPKDVNKIFITQKVKTLLFEGLEFAINSDEVGVACGIVRDRLIERVNPIRVITPQIDEDGITQSLKLAYFAFKVANPDGKYTVNRGIENASKLGSIIRWNDDEYITTWGRIQSTNNETCNRVRGTDATIFPPRLIKGDPLDIFSTDICRVVKIFYVGEGTYKGISGFRYETSKSTFTPETPNPENDCFCSKQTIDPDDNESCYLDGIFDYKPCLGAPVLVSFPHFLDADEKYGKAIDGMEPNETLHRIHVLIEPNTGTPLEGAKRVQLNSVLRPVSFIPSTANVQRAVIPILWVEEGVNLPQKYIDLINSQYFATVSMANGLLYGLIAATSAAVVVSTVFLLRKKFYKTKDKI